MEITTLYNLIGISILVTGAFIAARGFFLEKDENLIARTELSFGNMEHFTSMLNQKYSEIIGFFLIIIGSLIQFATNYLDLNCTLQFDKRLILLIIITGTLMLNLAFMRIIRFLTSRRFDKITIKGWILSYEEMLPHAHEAEYKKNSCDHSLEMITDILKRRFKKFSQTDPESIIDFAKKKFK